MGSQAKMMKMRAYKCVVELTIHAVSAPGVRLSNKDDLFLNVCLLGQQRRTRLVPPQFPLIFDDRLVFEKTFKYCRDTTDVKNFLGDLHALVELIQLGHNQCNEVLASYETSARAFLYPLEAETSYCGATDYYHSGQRGAFMTRHGTFPGSISPQLQFCTSTRIDFSQTPCQDMLREYENRFECDPTIQRANKACYTATKRKRGAAASAGILKNKNVTVPEVDAHHDNFASHTISSAIKADYALAQVKSKIEELNPRVKRTRVVKRAPSIIRTPLRERVSRDGPFVVRHVEDALIQRKPKSHEVLHDGLVLVKKRPHRSDHEGDKWWLRGGNSPPPPSSMLRSRSVDRFGYDDDSWYERCSRSTSPQQYGRARRSASRSSYGGDGGRTPSYRRARSLTPNTATAGYMSDGGCSCSDSFSRQRQQQQQRFNNSSSSIFQCDRSRSPSLLRTTTSFMQKITPKRQVTPRSSRSMSPCCNSTNAVQQQQRQLPKRRRRKLKKGAAVARKSQCCGDSEFPSNVRKLTNNPCTNTAAAAVAAAVAATAAAAAACHESKRYGGGHGGGGCISRSRSGSSTRTNRTYDVSSRGGGSGGALPLPDCTTTRTTTTTCRKYEPDCYSPYASDQCCDQYNRSYTSTTSFGRNSSDILNQRQYFNTTVNKCDLTGTSDSAFCGSASGSSTCLGNSYKDASRITNRISNSIKKNINDKCSNASQLDSEYSRYYPWLSNYTDYLKDLEDELNCLKVGNQRLGAKQC